MVDSSTFRQVQDEVCERLGVRPVPFDLKLKVGVARNVRLDLQPLNGLRHPPVGDTSGWYIWAGGEPSSDPDFFEPLHADHLVEWCPGAIPYLYLPPGWRFLIAHGVEDVWEDPTLLIID